MHVCIYIYILYIYIHNYIYIYIVRPSTTSYDSTASTMSAGSNACAPRHDKAYREL